MTQTQFVNMVFNLACTVCGIWAAIPAGSLDSLPAWLHVIVAGSVGTAAFIKSHKNLFINPDGTSALSAYLPPSNSQKGCARVEASICIMAVSCFLFGVLAFGDGPAAEYYDGGKGVLLPDPRVTPGAADPHVTQSNIAKTICQHNYTAKVRNVPESVKLAVFKEYGVDPRMSGLYEVDHLISLELGGANDITNLWPQKYEQDSGDPLGAHAKDKLENYLHRQVCSGHMQLADAQSQISHNWLIAYQTLVKGN